MKGPVICNQISSSLTPVLLAHSSRPHVIECFDRLSPWVISAETEILITRLYDAWSAAPTNGPALPKLRYVQTYSAGVEGYPDWLLHDRIVSCGRGLTSDQIAEYAMAAIIRVEKNMESFRVLSASDWRNRPMGRLAGRTLGLLGYGSIGQAIARRAIAFDMEVIAFRRGQWVDPPKGLTPCDTPRALFARSDHVVLALPLTVETRGIVEPSLLAHSKPGLHLINVSRGGLIDQDALVSALEDGRLSSATLDVITPEPPADDHPLLNRNDVFVTPHIAYAGGIQEMEKFQARILNNLDAYLEGRPLREQVDIGRGY
jgi:phosphoglycerate dehydrogenase-like enzyme